MTEIVKLVLGGGAVQLAIVLAGAAALLVMRGGRLRQYGYALLITLMAGYYVCALPPVAHWLSTRFTHFDQLRDVSTAEHATAIVVLAGDSEHARIVEALRLYKVLRPRWIIASGLPEMRDELLEGGVPVRQIVLDSSPRTTREQALKLAPVLEAKGIRQVVVVASAIHMPRAFATLRRAGIDAIPSASPTRNVDDLQQFRPAFIALRLSGESIYEYAALLYYRLRGWVP